MYPVERRKAILEILDHRGSVAVEELSKTLFTGEATVRRDLDRMAKEGIITRTRRRGKDRSRQYRLPACVPRERKRPR